MTIWEKSSLKSFMPCKYKVRFQPASLQDIFRHFSYHPVQTAYCTDYTIDKNVRVDFISIRNTNLYDFELDRLLFVNLISRVLLIGSLQQAFDISDGKRAKHDWADLPIS